jgi:hypothetical protein
MMEQIKEEGNNKHDSGEDRLLCFKKVWKIQGNNKHEVEDRLLCFMIVLKIEDAV